MGWISNQGPDFLNYLPIFVAKDYLWNEIDQVISRELFQNIGISIICVFISSGLLLAHLKSFMLVFLCVVLSMVDLIGFLHFWNLTVDIISYGCILISIGLCIGMIIKTQYPVVLNLHHSSLLKGLCLMKSKNKTLQNLSYFLFITQSCFYFLY